MRTNRIYLATLATFVALFLCTPVAAQIGIDVKTGWLEKHGLTAAKHGVLAAIESDPSTTTTEFGEDYALWLKNLRRVKGVNDTVVLTLDLELRKPSFMTAGELIARRTIEVRYHPATLDSLASTDGMMETIANRRDEHDAWNRLIGTAVGNLVPKGKGIVAPILAALLRHINAPPKPSEICESVLIGASVVEWLGSEIER